MIQIISRELGAFFSSLIAYIIIGVFLLFLGLFMWVFQETSVLNYNYATLDQLFTIAPMVFIFLIPAISMRSFAEEHQNGTLELLLTKPISSIGLILGKYFSVLILILFALLPTLIYFYSVHQLGSPVGNIDSGAVAGSYIGLALLSATFAAIGIFSSSISKNQIVSFVIGAFLCFLFHWGFQYLSSLPIFIGTFDNFVERLGIEYHYNSISRGVLDTRDILYFLSVITTFILATKLSIDKKNW
ncbi:gliding motility-associated ABC transporter permease subunit GldF [Portibacter lacus]|uniref:Gliding motility-associated ABC transporter permease subunit GldF n=1 Tax=Portibacter lacus TaxID=1099794 RepID=A0AA37SYU3_9BACT|nr:gliding motility-associated ABC transporter permease subunit GldF [Portibacter lacus]GLR20060.1 gliding motility-associated ABC transporter permease subunit GldF [Portibacter lacus]